ncbi:MAG: hypothetical protein EOO14_18455 [Chitinophagaceae bacterium]|nr:MAG: hypothetical protein EOO14_18455 [Chitinophagaceae bacterium]
MTIQSAGFSILTGVIFLHVKFLAPGCPDIYGLVSLQRNNQNSGFCRMDSVPALKQRGNWRNGLLFMKRFMKE